MSPLNQALLWAEHNPYYAGLIIYGVINFIVGITPQRLQNEKWYGWLILLMQRIALVNHADMHGSIQIPILAKALFMGEPLAKAVKDSMASPADTATVAALAAPPVPAAVDPDKALTDKELTDKAPADKGA